MRNFLPESVRLQALMFNREALACRVFLRDEVVLEQPLWYNTLGLYIIKLEKLARDAVSHWPYTKSSGERLNKIADDVKQLHELLLSVDYIREGLLKYKAAKDRDTARKLFADEFLFHDPLKLSQMQEILALTKPKSGHRGRGTKGRDSGNEQSHSLTALECHVTRKMKWPEIAHQRLCGCTATDDAHDDERCGNNLKADGYRLNKRLRKLGIHTSQLSVP